MPEIPTTHCIAVDCRGCGYSQLGEEAQFSQDALVQDLHDLLSNDIINQPRLVLLGHSMGARIALGFAATYPQLVKVLIMEDMDIGRRPISAAPFQVRQKDEPFDRQFTSKEAAVQGLLDAGYPMDRIETWLEQGRVEPKKEKGTQTKLWWSHVNPDFRRLCYQHIADTDRGMQDCQSIAAAASSDITSSLFPVHVLVAGEAQTICREESLQDMKEILGNRLTIHRFTNASHSIHSSAREEYLETIRDIVTSISSTTTQSSPEV
jgi:pimeloyl-ACP methyl ester carboxylesterase